MFNIVVCDDEEIIRKSIVSAFNAHTEFCVYEAAGGCETLALFKQRRINGVIMDIHMPDMCGLDTLRLVREELHSDAEAIVLSGYDTFEYAQQSIRYNCYDYVLKPVSSEELGIMAQDMLNRLKRKEQASDRLKALLDEIESLKPVMIERAFADLIDNISDSPYSNQPDELLVDLFSGFGIMRLVLAQAAGHILQTEGDDYRLKLYAINVCLRRCEETLPQAKAFSLSATITAIVVGEKVDDEMLRTYLEETIELCHTDFGVQLSAGIGSRAETLERLSVSYSDALKALSLVHVGHCATVMDISDALPDSARANGRSVLLAAIQLITPGSMNRGIEACRAALANPESAVHVIDIDSMLVLCSELISRGVETLEQVTACGAEYLSSCSRHPLKELGDYRTADELLRCTISALENMKDYIQNNSSKKDTLLVEAGKELIKRGYGAEIGVESLARHFYLSKTYFGQLFKANAGMSVNEYINYVRIDAAKAALKDPAKTVCEIAVEVGYKDVYYFSKVFKGIVGVSPSDYRKLL